MIITNLILIIKAFGLAFVLTHFTPFQMVLDPILNLTKNNLILNTIANILVLLISCISCASFWVGWLIGGFWIGVAAYILAFFYNSQFSYLELTKMKFPQVK